MKLIIALVLLYGVFWLWLTVSFMEDDLKFRLRRKRRRQLRRFGIRFKTKTEYNEFLDYYDR